MIGKVIGAIAGAQASKFTKSLGGTGGAIAGALAVPVIRRMSWPALVAISAGGYLAKKLIERDANGPGGTRVPAAKADQTGSASNS